MSAASFKSCEHFRDRATFSVCSHFIFVSSLMSIPWLPVFFSFLPCDECVRRRCFGYGRMPTRLWPKATARLDRDRKLRMKVSGTHGNLSIGNLSITFWGDNNFFFASFLKTSSMYPVHFTFPSIVCL